MPIFIKHSELNQCILKAHFYMVHTHIAVKGLWQYAYRDPTLFVNKAYKLASANLNLNTMQTESEKILFLPDS
jgi:hypothetical protein